MFAKKFLYRYKHCLNLNARRMLCNALIQPLFDYACCSWYPNLKVSLKNKIQTTQNRCIRFCLDLHHREHLTDSHFRQINWLPTALRVDQNNLMLIYNHFYGNSPTYMNDVFIKLNSKCRTRNSFYSYKISLLKHKCSRNSVAYKAATLWNSIPNNIKDCSNSVLFKHTVKKHFLSMLEL